MTVQKASHASKSIMIHRAGNYLNRHFSEYRTKSVQEFRFELSQGIRSQIFFFAIFVKNIETHIKSNAMTKALKQLVCQQVYHL